MSMCFLKRGEFISGTNLAFILTTLVEMRPLCFSFFFIKYFRCLCRKKRCCLHMRIWAIPRQTPLSILSLLVIPKCLEHYLLLSCRFLLLIWWPPGAFLSCAGRVMAHVGQRCCGCLTQWCCLRFIFSAVSNQFPWCIALYHYLPWAEAKLFGPRLRWGLA